MAKGLYGAYAAAGKTGGAYRASLYDVQGVEYEKEHSRRMYEIEEAERQRITGAITEGISLASNIYGGVQAQKERAAEIEGLGESRYESSLKEDISWGEDIGDVKEWGDLSSAEKGEWSPQQTYGETKLWDLARGKADLGEGETRWGEVGERLSVAFGDERKYDWQGKEWTGSELSAKAKIERALERGLPIGDIGDTKSEIVKLQESFGKEVEEKQPKEKDDLVGYQQW